MLIKDLYGGTMATSGSDGALFDFGSVNWTTVTKALWAGAKCANPMLPRYRDWAATSDGIDLFDTAGAVIEEINKELFRFGVSPVSQ